MSQRPLVLVVALTIGDYLLWNWSLNANHTVIALVSGLTLPPLALAAIWLTALAVGRLLARTAGRPATQRGGRRRAHVRPQDVRRSAGARAREQSAAANGQAATSSSDKLAA